MHTTTLYDHSGILFRILKINSQEKTVAVGTTADMETFLQSGLFPKELTIHHSVSRNQIPFGILSIGTWFKAVQLDGYHFEFQRYEWSQSTGWFKILGPIKHIMS
jgi:hypothetical protein